MLKNKKLFFTFSLIFILFVLLFNTNVQAFSENEKYNYICDTSKYYEFLPIVENDKYYKDGYDFFYYYNYGERKLCVIYIKKENININPYLHYLRTADGINECFNIYFSNITDETQLDYKSYYIDTNNKTLVEYCPDWIVQSNETGSFIDSCTGYINNNDLTIAFNTSFNKEIYTNSTNSEVFLMAPTRLGMVTLGAEPAKILKEILEILPMTLVVVVSYLGLRKALEMLSNLLHQS